MLFTGGGALSLAGVFPSPIYHTALEGSSFAAALQILVWPLRR